MAITAVNNVAYVSPEVEALAQLQFAIGRYVARNPKVRARETLDGNAEQLLPKAINKYALCSTLFLNSPHITKRFRISAEFVITGLYYQCMLLRESQCSK